MSEWMNEWMNEWMHELMNEWMNSIKKQIIYLVIINSIPKAVGRKLKSSQQRI